MGILNFSRRHCLQLVHRRLLPLGDVGPVVSFTFDDFPRTAYTTGAVILKDLGARGTFYTATGLMGSTTTLGDQFYIDDLLSLAADRHEVANHTFHHISSRTTSVHAYRDDVLAGRAALRKIPGLTISDNFAYPFGAVTMATKRVLAKEMRSCRSTLGGVNGPLVDLNLLRANALYGDIEQLGLMRRLLDDAERLRGWLIIYTHDVSRTPSPYGCTPKLFEAVMRLVRQKSTRVLTVDQVLTAARATSAPRPDAKQ